MLTKQAKDIKRGDIVLWHGLRMEVTHARSSRRYPGYRAVQFKDPQTGDIIGHDIYWSDNVQIEGAP